MRRLCVAVFVAALSFAAAPAFDPRPWLQDLDQTKQVFLTQYADLEWAVFDREADLPGLFAETAARIRQAHNDNDARAAFDRLARHLGDEHVGFDRPSPQSASSDGPQLPCGRYNPGMVGAPLAAKMDGYRAIPGPVEFPSGLIDVNGTRLGVLKIGLFETLGWPQMCEAALVDLKIDKAKPCDDACSDRIDAWAAAQMTRDLATQLRALQTAGAKALLIDIASNGGGSEWAEAAARIVSAKRITSEAVHFDRGDHWTKRFTEMEAALKLAAQTAPAMDRRSVLRLVAEAEALRQIAATPCDASVLWEGKHPTCSPLGEGFYSTGLLPSMSPARFQGRAWAPEVFSPAQYPYEEHVWQGPLLVLIDRDTASAASEFAAVLQDNKAAVIIGEPASGGCGHTDGGTPVTLKHSKGVLSIPDCARFRADGTNEARGIVPDMLVGFTPADGPTLRAARLLATLPRALDEASVTAPGH